MPAGASSRPRRRRETLSPGEARRIALAAQGFGQDAPAEPSLRDVRRMARRLGAVQIDSVNVLVRSHYLPLFSRLGAYDPALLEAAAYAGRRRSLFEYWGHEASFLPVELHPLLRWRMARAEQGEGIWGMLARFGRERRDTIDAVHAELRARGPSGASEVGGGGRGAGAWWGWSDTKTALEWLFWAGRVTVARRRGFERIYDLAERALPSAILAAPTPSEADAKRALLRIAAKALGIATERDLRDYFRLDVAGVKLRIAELVEEGDLIPVAVPGWTNPAFLEAKARIPRRVAGQALLSPFDSLVWDRTRTERMFGFRYRLALYTPAEKREHGYYVLPFLKDEQLVGRVDLKADRRNKRLLVCATHFEPGIDAAAFQAPLDEELQRLAAWLGLDEAHRIAQGDLEAPDVGVSVADEGAPSRFG